MATSKEVEDMMTDIMKYVGKYKEVEVLLLTLDRNGNFYFITPWSLTQTVEVVNSMVDMMEDKAGERSVH